MQQEGFSEKYALSKSFHEHRAAVRSVAVKGDRMLSAGIDKKVVLYTRQDNGIFEKTSEYTFFKDYVYTVEMMEDDEQFMVGCKDNKIYICFFADTEGPMLCLEGHTGPVNSLSQKGTTLVSGSWDATAKIWDLESGECTATLEGHAYAVTVTIASTGSIITGSQDGNLSLWSDTGNLITRKEGAHKDIIRDIIEVPGIGVLTCSNDSSIKMWGLQNLEEFANYKHHESFVFALASLGGSDFVSGGEDFRLKVCLGGQVKDEVLLPNTVWGIAVDEKADQDLITACGDGIVRIFTRNNARKAAQDEIESFENEAKMAAMQGPTLDQKTLNSFDTVDKMATIRGKKEGEIRVFRQGQVPKAFMWKGGKWELVGDVMGQQHQKKSYPGDRYFPAGEYDYVFSVQDDSGLNRRLPFNDGDNPLVAAEKFLVREGMNMGYKEQIIKFIQTNARGGGKIGKNQANKANQGPKKEVIQPIREKKFFRKFNLDGLQNKLLELNEQLKAAKAPEAITDNEAKHFKSLVAKLRDPKIYNYIKEFNSFEGMVLKKLLKWPAQQYIPVLDLVRILVVHHASQAFFSGVDSGIGIFVSIVSKLKDGGKVAWKLLFKFLGNMCINDSNAIGLVKASDILFDAFAQIDLKDAKLLVLVANYVMTLSSSIDVIPTADDKLAERYVSLIANIVSAGALNDESVMKFAIAVINFGVLKPGCKGGALSSLSQLLVNKLQGVESPVKNRLVKGLKGVGN